MVHTPTSHSLSELKKHCSSATLILRRPARMKVYNVDSRNSISVYLFSGVVNAGALLEGNLGLPPVSFLDARMIPDISAVLSCAQRALVPVDVDELSSEALHDSLLDSYGELVQPEIRINANSDYILAARINGSEPEMLQIKQAVNGIEIMELTELNVRADPKIKALGKKWWQPIVAFWDLDSATPRSGRDPLSYQGAFRKAFDSLGYKGPISINACIQGKQASDRRMRQDMEKWSVSCHSETIFMVISNDEDHVDELQKLERRGHTVGIMYLPLKGSIFQCFTKKMGPEKTDASIILKWDDVLKDAPKIDCKNYGFPKFKRNRDNSDESSPEENWNEDVLPVCLSMPLPLS